MKISRILSEFIKYLSVYKKTELSQMQFINKINVFKYLVFISNHNWNFGFVLSFTN